MYEIEGRDIGAPRRRGLFPLRDMDVGDSFSFNRRDCGKFHTAVERIQSKYDTWDYASCRTGDIIRITRTA